MRVLACIAAAALILTIAQVAHPAEPSSPAKALQPFIDNHDIAGAVTLVANPDKILDLSAVGYSSIARREPMEPDSIFWIASMTKPITGTAIMILQEQGKLSLDDPIGKYIPELAHMKTRDGQEHVLTIRHIMTHTSGMSDVTNDESKAAHTLGDLVPAVASKPLRFVPGSKWEYNQAGINTAGRIVEIVSGQSYPEFLQQHIFGPLGMKDTTFYLTAEQMKRLATSYKAGNGQLEEAANYFLQGRTEMDHSRYPAANGGLFSTAADYGRFLQMVLNNGELDGRRILKPETVKLMTSVQSGGVKTGFTPGNAWGIGWCLVRQPQGVTGMLAPGACGHGGAYGTQAWIDPAKGLAMVLMVQRSNFPNSDDSPERKAFQQAAVDRFGK